jgi:RNA polymerase sigma factor (sigma-70 family)
VWRESSLGPGTSDDLSDRAAEDSGHTVLAALREIEPQLRQTLGRFGIPLEDGEDLLQDSLLILLERCRQAERPVERPAGFLLGVLRRRCVMYWRQRRARREEPLIAVEVRLEPGQEQVEQGRYIRQLLGAVGARYRRLLLLRLALGYSPEEVASMTGLARASVRKSVLRARHRICARQAEEDLALRALRRRSGG